MANKNGMIMAAIAVAVAVCQHMSADVVEELSRRFRVSKQSVISMADEVLAAREAAETDMNLFH